MKQTRQRACLQFSDIKLDQALNGPEKMQWQQAIDREMAGLEERNTFEDEPCPKENRPLGTRYVLTKKGPIIRQPSGSSGSLKDA